MPAALLRDLSPANPFAQAAAGPRYVREGYSQEEAKPFAGGARRTYNSVDSIHQFFQRPGRHDHNDDRGRDGRGGPPSDRQIERQAAAPAHVLSARSGAVSPGALRSGSRVRHAKFGVGTVLRVEGEGELTKLTISFPGFGLKKLLEKMAALQPV